MRVTREGGDGDGEKGAAARSQCPRGKSLQHKGKDECPERRRGERTVDESSGRALFCTKQRWCLADHASVLWAGGPPSPPVLMAHLSHGARRPPLVFAGAGDPKGRMEAARAALSCLNEAP